MLLAVVRMSVGMPLRYSESDRSKAPTLAWMRSPVSGSGTSTATSLKEKPANAGMSERALAVNQASSMAWGAPSMAAIGAERSIALKVKLPT
ncbi:hypothetical protein D3C72_2143500 [compost metagenome]